MAPVDPGSESRSVARRDLAVAAAAGVVVAAAAAVWLSVHCAPVETTAAVAAAVVGILPVAVADAVVLSRSPLLTSPADRITLVRAVLGCGCAAMAFMVVVGQVPQRLWVLFALAVVTLALDAVDGPVARRTGSASAAGARLDMEVDAVVLLVLTVALVQPIGVWVVLIGAMRYLYGLATLGWPALSTPIPRSRFRVAVAAFQATAVGVALAPAVSHDVATVTLAVALVLLLLSFGHQLFAVRRTRRRGGPPA